MERQSSVERKKGTFYFLVFFGVFVVSTEKGSYYMKRPEKDSKGRIESISYKMGEEDEAGREITFVISEELISRLK